MIGVSIYLAKERVKKQEEWLKVAKENGFSSIFTSLHIPEDDPGTYKELIQMLGKQALENNMELMVDVSPKSLHHLGMTYENVEGSTGLGHYRLKNGLRHCAKRNRTRISQDESSFKCEHDYRFILERVNY